MASKMMTALATTSMHALDERRQVLRLAVPVRVVGVGGASGDPQREERQQGRHQIGPAVHRLGDQRKAVGADARRQA